MFGRDRVAEDAESPFDVSVEELPDESVGAVDLDLAGPVAIDLGAIRDELVVEGWHTVRVERAEARRSKEQKLAMIFILSRVTDESDVEFNRTIIWNCMLEGDGMVFTKRCFAALGMPERLNYPTYQALADALKDRDVDVQVRHKTSKGQKTANVNNWRPVTPDINF